MNRTPRCFTKEARDLLYVSANTKISAITSWYLAVIVFVFPFFATDQYFRILRDRTLFFVVATAFMTLFMGAIYVKLLTTLLWECIQEGGGPCTLLQVLKADQKLKMPRLTMADRGLLCFLCIMALSTICSEYPVQAFWGGAGRYQGLCMWLLYGITYVCVSRYWKPDMRLIYVFLAGGVASALWGIANYLGLDPFCWHEFIKEEQRGIFVSSYGNINTYTAAMSIFMAIAGSLYMMEPKGNQTEASVRLRNPWYLVSFFLLCVALITGRSDNAALAILAFFVIVPFFTWNSGRDVHRYSHLCAGFLCAMAMSAYLSEITENPYINASDGILLKLCNNNFVMMALCLFGVLWVMVTTILAKKKETYKVKTWWAFILILGISTGILALILFREHPLLTNSPIGPFLQFSDSWGSHRGYIWRAAIEEFMKGSLKNMTIGTGPETFGLIIRELRYDEMKAITGQIFDSPHNEGLQYLFTTGVLGFVAYYGFIFGSCVLALKHRMGNPVVIPAAVAVFVYTVVSVVNISVPMTQVYMILLLAMINHTQKSF